MGVEKVTWDRGPFRDPLVSLAPGRDGEEEEEREEKERKDRLHSHSRGEEREPPVGEPGTFDVYEPPETGA